MKLLKDLHYVHDNFDLNQFENGLRFVVKINSCFQKAF